MRSPAQQPVALVERRLAALDRRRRPRTPPRAPSSAPATGRRRRCSSSRPARSSSTRPMPTTRTLMISIAASKRWPYSASCAAWKPSASSSTQASSIAPGGHVEAHLVALAGVAAVGEAPHAAAGPRARRRRRAARRPASASSSKRALEPLAVERLQRVPLRRDVLVLQVGGEQAGRRDDARGAAGTSTRGISSSSAMSQAKRRARAAAAARA